eukprot:1536661-Pyramimonas_sp.AAC.1
MPGEGVLLPAPGARAQFGGRARAQFDARRVHRGACQGRPWVCGVAPMGNHVGALRRAPGGGRL